MLIKTQFETSFAYHWHTTALLLDHAANLSAEELNQSPEYGQGSIHALFLHLLHTNWGWRTGMETGRQPLPADFPDPEDYPDLAALQTALEREKAEWDRYLDSLTVSQIEAELELIGRDGQIFRFECWRILQHLVLHGMQHHAELAALLTDRGQSPGNLDFIFYR